jgi:multidrug resistance efflux pump
VERTVVRAPIAGVIDSRAVEIGSMVTPGAPVARLVDAATVKITGGVPERYAADIVRGAEMRVSFDGMAARSTPAASSTSAPRSTSTTAPSPSRCRCRTRAA